MMQPYLTKNTVYVIILTKKKGNNDYGRKQKLGL